MIFKNEGYAFGANNVLRNQNGQNIDASWQYPLELIASGISVMRRNRTVQLSADELHNGMAASFRGETDYAGAVCQYGNGQPAFELLNSSEVLWGFSSSSLSLQYAQSWPWLKGSPRVLVMARNVSNVESGAAVVWPIPVLSQMEVTFPPGTEFQHLACERATLNGAPVALLYGYDRSSTGGGGGGGGRRLSTRDESALLKSLQKSVTRAEQGCYRYVCAYMCSVAATPTSCDCVDAHGQRPAAQSDANALVTPASCAPLADQAMLLKSLDWEGLCVTAASATVGARVSTQLCAPVGRRSALQAFYFDARGFVMLNATRDSPSGPCV